MLFISHLHKDHISGIPHLLKKLKEGKGKCNNVYLPYFTPTQRLFYIAEYLYKNQDASLSDKDVILSIIKNPHKYFSDLDLDIKVFYLKKKEENDNANDQTYDDKFKTYSSNYFDENEDENKNVFFIEGGEMSFTNFWEFNVFCKSIEKSKLDGFKEKIKNKFGIFEELKYSKLEEILKKHNKNDLKKLYKEKINNDLNKTSLMLLHRPIYQLNYCLKCNRNSKICNLLNEINSKYCMSESTLLTGDRPLESLTDNDFNIGDQLGTIYFFQVPHHGSDTGWKEVEQEIKIIKKSEEKKLKVFVEGDGENKILKSMNNCCLSKIAIICCRQSEKFPLPIVLKDLISNSFNVKIVDDTPFEYLII